MPREQVRKSTKLSSNPSPKKFLGFSIIIFIAALAASFIIGVQAFPSYLYVMETDGETGQAAIFSGSLLSVIPSDEAVPAAFSGDERISGIQIEASLSFFGKSVKNVTVEVLPETKVVPCGITAGITIDTTGLMVLGSGPVPSRDGTGTKPCEGKIKPGDMILKADGIEITDQYQFKDYMDTLEPGATVTLEVSRDGDIITEEVTSAVSSEDGRNTLGLYIRDSTRGIGTITYYDPESSRFAALGHGVVDVDTKRLIPVKTGNMYEADITGVKRGGKGSPGELVGQVDNNMPIGTITENTEVGLFGSVTRSYSRLPESMANIALQTKIHEGPAAIISNVSGHSVKQYDIYIEQVNHYSQDESKGMIIRITDQELITRTNGIVQGMSGCPIIQDGALIGAVTHVFVNNPLKGYGIFIENMLKQEREGA